MSSRIEAARGADETTRARYAAACGVWLFGVVTAAVAYGMLDEVPWSSSLKALPVNLLLLLLALLWATFPFLVVSVAILERTAGGVAIATAMLIAAAGLVIVPRLVQRSIESDESSTAGLVHIYDPVLISLPVGIVIAASWISRRRKAARLAS